MPAFNIYEAKSSLSKLVERAVAGEDVIIAKAGKPLVRLVPVQEEKKRLKRRSGQNDLRVTYVAPDFDEPLPEDVLQSFGY